MLLDNYLFSQLNVFFYDKRNSVSKYYFLLHYTKAAYARRYSRAKPILVEDLRRLGIYGTKLKKMN